MKALLLSLYLLPLFLHAEILEIDRLDEIFHYTSKKNLIIACDIDNTLLMSSTHLGSVAWADHVIATLESKGISTHEANMIENILWKSIQPHIPVKLVDPNAPKVLKTVHERQIPFIAVTARAPHEEAYTLAQLSSLDLHCPIVLYASPFNKKSDVFFTYLAEQNLLPEYILFIDDKWSHIQDMEQACLERNIHYIGLRLSAADEQVMNYNPSIAEIQWKAFPQILTDEEASGLSELK